MERFTYIGTSIKNNYKLVNQISKFDDEKEIEKNHLILENNFAFLLNLPSYLWVDLIFSSILSLVAIYFYKLLILIVCLKNI